MAVYRSEIDSERFGVCIARAETVTGDLLPQILDDCSRAGVRMLIARCAGADLPSLQAMERAGFLLMDAQVKYERRLVGPEAAGGALVRPLRPGDVGAVVAIARESFGGYAGHYHADQRLPRELCDEVYPSWASRCCSGEAADHVVVAEVDGRVAGFSAFQRLNEAEARLQLGAVAPWARGHQLYTTLTFAGMAWCGEQRLSRMSAITQTTNLAAQQSWIRSGMMPVDAWYTFHRWFD
ncbi:MAG TPA: GNAT family N-acetyltransferase [Candidatus Dormibacteraeota bacterium]|nr:GNAT family N-acetyltransferase [Candidatus Dormibacteraeota bacterium]